MNMRIYKAAATLALGLGLMGGASAQSTWSLVSGSGCSQNAANAGNYANSWACTGVGTAGTSATASAWSNDRGAGGTAQAGAGWANAYMSPQGSLGFGAASRTEVIGIGSPDHSIDNISPGTYDFVMVQFTSAVILEKFGIGWGAGDSDMTVMRWTGNTAPTGGTGSVTTGGNGTLNNTIASGGWTLVNSFANVCKDSSSVQVFNASCDAAQSTVSTGAAIGSSYWLISAFNTTMDTVSGMTDTNDGFKLNFLRTVAYTCPAGQTSNGGGTCAPNAPNGTPEPGSLALLAAAALAGAVTRRRWLKRG